MKACEKRPVGYASVEKLVDTLQAELQASGEKEIESVRIGERVMAELLKIDDVAYVRFASVYRQFKDANQFVDEIRALITESSERKARP
jgi:transcriptional repressor NrdR